MNGKRELLRMEVRRRREKLFLTLVLLAAIGLTLYAQYPLLRDPYKVVDDARIWLYWTPKYQDDALFPDDPLMGSIQELHMLGGAFYYHPHSAGYYLLYWFASHFEDPLFFNKILPLFLMAFSVFYLFRLGACLRSPYTGLFLSSAFVLYNLSAGGDISVLHGLQRSFGYPLLIIFLYYLMSEKDFKAVIVMLIQLTIYPPVFVISAVTYVVNLVMERRKVFAAKKVLDQVFGLLAALGLSVILIAPIFFVADEIKENVLACDDVVDGARIGVFTKGTYLGIPNSFILGEGGVFAAEQTATSLLPFLALSLIIIAALRKDSWILPRAFYALLASGIGLFVAAWLIAGASGWFLLYLPSRYTLFTLPLFLVLFVSFNVEHLVRKAVSVCAGRMRLILSILTVIFILSLGVFSPSFVENHLSPDGVLDQHTSNVIMLMRILLLPMTLYLVTLTRQSFTIGSNGNQSSDRIINRLSQNVVVLSAIGLTVLYSPMIKCYGVVSSDREERLVLEYLSTLPKDVLIAGYPYDTDNIPIFARRSVFVSAQLSGGRSRRQMITDLFDAYFSDSLEDVKSFCRQYKITHLLINKKRFTRDFLNREKHFYTPHDRHIKQLIRGREIESFILADMKKSRVFETDQYYILKMT